MRRALLLGCLLCAALAGAHAAPFDDLETAVDARLDALATPATRAERRESRALTKVRGLLATGALPLPDAIAVARRIEVRVARRVPVETGLDVHLDAVAAQLHDDVAAQLAFVRLALGSARAKTVRERVDRSLEKAAQSLLAATDRPTRKKSLGRLARALAHLRAAERLFVRKDVVPVASALASPAGQIADARIEEGSGIVWLDGAFWTHGDGGDGARLYRSASAAFHDSSEVEIEGAVNIDWEDLAVLGGDLLVCDVGDNQRTRDQVTLYRVRPTPSGAQLVATHPFAYPDGAHDAEAVTVIDGRVHVFTKGDPEVATSVYRFDSLVADAVNVPVRLGGLDLPTGSLVTAADVDPRTGTLALLVYGGVLLYRAGMLSGAPERIVPAAALQSEALCFHRDTLVVTNEQRGLYLVPRFLDRR